MKFPNRLHPKQVFFFFFVFFWHSQQNLRPQKNIWCKNVPSRCGPFGHLCQTFAPPMGLLEGVTPAKFSFTNASSLHGVCSDGSLVGNRESGEGVNDFGRNLNLISLYIIRLWSWTIFSIFFYTCQWFVALCSIYVQYFCHHSNFQSCRFSGVICSSCMIYIDAYAPFNFTFLWNSIHQSTSVQTRSPASYLCPRLCAFDSRHLPYPCLSREPGNEVPCKCRCACNEMERHRYTWCILMEDCFPGNQLSVRVRVGFALLSWRTPPN